LDEEAEMRRVLRYGLILLGILLIVVIALPFLVSVDRFRPIIEERLSGALGRQTRIGNLSLAVLSGSLSAESLSIADDPKFSNAPFLKAGALRIGVELWPLIRSGTIIVTGLTIERPEVQLIRDPAGRWNFSTLATNTGSTDPSAPAAKPAAQSAPAPRDIRINQLSLQNGKIVIGTSASKQQSTYDNVDVTASDVSLRSKFPVKITADLPGGGNFSLEGQVGPINRTNSLLTPLNAKLMVNSMDLAKTGALDPSLGLGGLLDVDATFSAENAQASTQGTARLTKALLVAGGSPASIPVVADFSTRYDLQKNSGTLNASTVKIGQASARLAGTYQTAADNTTKVNLQIEGQNMPATDLQAFLPALGITLPTGASLTKGTINAKLNAQGATNALVTSGNVGLSDATLAGFNLGSKLSAIAALAGVNSTSSDVGIEKMTMNLRMAPNGLRIDNFLGVISGLGNLVGSGTIDPKGNLDFKMAATLTGASASGTQTGIGGVLSRLTRSSSGGCKTITAPFLVQGTTADPTFIPDVGGAAASLLKSYLSGCPGDQNSTSTAAPSSTSGAAPAPSSNPLDRLGDIFRKKQ
jgi:AsmA protein